MATISTAALLPVLDSLGVMYDILGTIAQTAEADALAAAADGNVTRLLALTDIGQVKDLAAGFDALQVATLSPIAGAATIFQPIIKSIDTHVTQLNSYLTTQEVQVSRSFADMYRAIKGESALTPANVFEDQVVVGRTVSAITGATTVTQAAGTDLDKTKVAPVQYQIHVTTDIGSATTVTLTMKKADGTTEPKVVELTTADDAGEDVPVGTADDVYIGCTNVAITGGTTGAFTVRNTLPRVPVV